MPLRLREFVFVNDFGTPKEALFRSEWSSAWVGGSLEPSCYEQHFIHRLYLPDKAFFTSLFLFSRSYYLGSGGSFKFISVCLPFPPRTVTFQLLRSSKKPQPPSRIFPSLVSEGSNNHQTSQQYPQDKSLTAVNLQLDTNPRPKVLPLK